MTAVSTNPLWMVKVRMQTAQPNSLYYNTFQTFQSIVRNEGILALYKGLGANLIGKNSVNYHKVHQISRVICGYDSVSPVRVIEEIVCTKTYENQK